jgi:hypothetical protein
MSPAPSHVPVTVFRWDLDKTYLRTEFDRLRDLVRVPFEKAADKVGVPGVAELMRSVRGHAQATRRELRVYFLSASPPQIARAIREKFALDGVEIDGIVFKDQLQILMRGRFRGLREQIGYKLTELLRGRLAAGGEVEYLFGDDWETDAIVYSLYADVVGGRLPVPALERVLEEVPVGRDWREQILRLARRLRPAEAVRRIFINLERRTPPGSFRVFGPRVVPTFNYFQTAACLFEEGCVDLGGVERVGEALVADDGYTREMLENSLADLARRGYIALGAAEPLREGLARRGLLPVRRLPLRARIGGRVRRWARRRRRVDDRIAVPVEIDYLALVGAGREGR